MKTARKITSQEIKHLEMISSAQKKNVAWAKLNFCISFQRQNAKTGYENLFNPLSGDAKLWGKNLDSQL